MLKCLNSIQFNFSIRFLIKICGLLLFYGTGQAEILTEMRVFSDSFISPYFEATEKTHYQFVGAHLKSVSNSEDIFNMDVSGGLAVGSPLMNYLNISELYFKIKQDSQNSIYIGRKKMLWSELDARWEMGVWEPIFEWNPLSPDRQGLTGFFYQLERRQFSLLLFGSPIFIPDQGPSFDIDDGKFVKGNPWFRRPPENVRLWDQITEIEYHYETPDQSKIVFQNSYGMQVAVGSSKGFKAQASYIYKPANQIAVGYDGSLDLAAQKGDVDLLPQSFYHSLIGLDITQKYENFRIGVSGLHDRPSQEKVFESKWTHSVFEDATMISPFVEWSNGTFGFNLQHLQMEGADVKEVGPMVDNSSRTPLSIRYPFKEAQQISLIGNFNFSKDRKWISKVSYLHSTLNEFDLIRLSSRIVASKLWSFFGEMQLLTAAEPSVENQNEIYQYVNNDRIMIGVAYAL